MAWEFIYRCDRCGRVEQVSTGDFRFYLVPWQGGDVPLFNRVHCCDQEAWCHNCLRMRAAEQIPDIELLEYMRESMFQLGEGMENDPLKGEVEATLRHMETQIHWRRERKSPPKCFRCGSTAIEPIDESFRHPGCGGVFQIAAPHIHSVSLGAFLIPAEGPHPRRWWEFWKRF